jgi:putative membrane protein
MRMILGIATLAGLLLAFALVAIEGVGAMIRVLASARWGILVAAFVHLWPLMFCAGAWGALMPPTWRPPLPALFLFRWIREGVNSILPVAQVGGVIVQARLLSFRGLSADLAGASVIVDMTLEVTALLLFALLGLGLFAARGQAQSAAWLAIGLVMGCPAIIGLIAAQRFGLIRLLAGLTERLAKRSGWRSPLLALDNAIQAFYSDRRRLAVGAALHLSAWCMSAMEILVLLRFMGEPIGPRDAVIMASLGYAVRATGFLVPGALGIQEGGFMLLAMLVGIPAQQGLALSFAKRAREMMLGVPAILAWQVFEGLRLWKRARPGLLN